MPVTISKQAQPAGEGGWGHMASPEMSKKRTKDEAADHGNASALLDGGEYSDDAAAKVEDVGHDAQLARALRLQVPMIPSQQRKQIWCP